VHHAHVLLRRAQLQASLKVIQGWPVSNSMEHLAPQVHGGHALGLISPRAALAS
jgi:hypothetical protein